MKAGASMLTISMQFFAEERYVKQIPGAETIKGKRLQCCVNLPPVHQGKMSGGYPDHVSSVPISFTPEVALFSTSHIIDSTHL